MDGCMYEYTRSFVDGCQVAAAKAIVESVPHLTDDDFEKIRSQGFASYLKTGSSIAAFVEKYNLDYDTVNALYHKFIETSHIDPLADLPGAFEKAVNKGHKICLATHSHINFASRLITHLKLHQTFNAKSNMLTLEQVGSEHMKHKNAEMALEAARRMGEDLRNLALVEDTAKNLIPVKDAGGTTILIHWGKKPETRPSYVDYMFKTPVDVLRSVIR